MEGPVIPLGQHPEDAEVTAEMELTSPPPRWIYSGLRLKAFFFFFLINTNEKSVHLPSFLSH